jgi:DnaJ-class molecular chaperone
MEQETHYQVLRVSSDASRTEIKQAFVTLALQHHPDRQSLTVFADEQLATCNTSFANDLSSTYRRIQTAWDCLQDSRQRRIYDQSLFIQQQQNNAKRQSAIVIRLDDCHAEQQQIYEIPQNLDTDGCYFNCRCGQELDVHTEVNDLLECTACSLTYDTAPVFQEDD